MSGSVASVPASQFVNVTPSVIGAGGDAFDLTGLELTSSVRVPIGAVYGFQSQSAVAAFFGSSSDEATAATIYFGGFNGATKTPGTLLFAQYNTAAVSGYLRSGSLSGMTLAQLQALNASLSVIRDGGGAATGSINLSAATSFSQAAQLIEVGLVISGGAAAAFTGSITATTLTVTVLASGTLAVGQKVAGGATSAGTFITAILTGTGGVGTYTVNNSQSVTSGSLTTTQPAVYWDTVLSEFVIQSATTGASSSVAFATGALATSLNLTQTLGAVVSPGAVIAVPATLMNNIKQVTQNWACFATLTDPDGGSGNTLKLAFAAWAGGQGKRFAYVACDTDASPVSSPAATTSLGYLVTVTYQYDGVIPVWVSSAAEFRNKGAFVLGWAAALDTEATNGRATLAYRYQDGLIADVTSQLALTNLIANGYNAMVATATATTRFTFMSDGSISGTFNWADTFVNEIWMTNEFQLALLEFLVAMKSVPYNSPGRAGMVAALTDPTQAALNFGAIRAGVTLSNAQIAEVNALAGIACDKQISTAGYFIQVLDATAQVRGARQSPPFLIIYTDGESVQAINLASVVVQ